MKRGTIDHPKMARLARMLRVEHFSAVGILESLWHFVARHAMRGDVGRWSDEEIADAVKWRKDPQILIAALVASKWLDQSEVHRLLVHDWHEHADDSVKKTLRNRGENFATLSDDFRKIPEKSGNGSPKPEPSLSQSLAKPEPSTAEAPGPDVSGKESEDPPEEVSGLEAEVVHAWNSSEGCIHVRLPLSLSRRKALRIRCRDPAWDWRAALAKFPLAFLEDGGWRPDFDWFLRPDSVNRILEGKYDWKKTDGKSKPKLTGGQQFDPNQKCSW